MSALPACAVRATGTVGDGMSWRRRVGTLGVLVTAMLVPAAPASAVHLFPLTPTFDPAGHDCAKNLVAAPPGSAATVSVSDFRFTDSSGDSQTSVVAGQSITWRWGPDHCHSVTFGGGLGGTRGAPGFQPPQPELIRLNGPGKDSFTMRFDQPGTFDYLCVHHASVGMRGRVVVTPRAGGPPAGAPGGNSGAAGTRATISRARVVPRRLRRGRRGRIVFRIDRPARVVVQFARVRRGRPTRFLHDTIAKRAKTGRNRIRFTGRLGGRRLRPGRYRLRLIATTDQGVASRSKPLSVVIAN
jgi:plastocyanin